MSRGGEQMDLGHDRAVIMPNEDRISNLPDDVIHRILSFLDTIYAVQTSTLSQRWKLMWKSMPNLNLYSNQFDTLPKFAKFVKHVLSHRDNLTEVSAVDLYFTGAATQFFLRSIINYACSHNVKKMTFTYMPNNVQYLQEFPLRLLSNHTLKHLSVTGYRGSYTVPKSAWDFPALETLHLNNITFCGNTDKSLDLFSKCVNLKNLIIDGFNISRWEVFNVCAPQLSNLTITKGFNNHGVFNVVAPQLDNLTVSVYRNKYVVSAPRLSSITCDGCGPPPLSTDGFCSLEKVNLSLSMFRYSSEEDVPILLDFLQKLGSAKFLTLYGLIPILAGFRKDLSSCLDRLSHQPCPFDNLKCLRIDAVQSEKDHTATISTQIRNYFLENSPHATFIMDLPEEKPKKSRKRVRKTAEEKTMLDAKKQAQYEHAELDATILKAKHFQVKGLMLQIIEITIEELRLQIEGGVPDHERIVSVVCCVRSILDAWFEGDRIDMEAQFFSQYEVLKLKLDTRIDSSQWAKIDKTLSDIIHQPPTSSSSAKYMLTSSSVASASGSKSVVQPLHNSPS